MLYTYVNIPSQTQGGLTEVILSLEIRSRKRPGGKSLHKDVSSLIRRANRKKTQDASRQMMMHKMTINLNMLGALMENIIMRNLNSTTVVTQYDSR